MQTLKVEANYRSDVSKSRAKQLRREGYATASINGKNKDTIPVEIKLSELAGAIKHSESGINSIIEMQVNGGPADSSGTVIIKHFTKDPIGRKVIDVVFQRVVMSEQIHVEVPVELEGEAPCVHAGGVVDQLIDEINISSLPGEIPLRVVVDISNMQIGDVIRVKDLDVGKGTEILADPDTVVCTCRAALVEPSEEAAEAAATEGETA